MRIFIDGAIDPVAANRNHTLLLNNNLRSNINHKLQLNNNRNNLNKNTKKKIQAGWCREDFIGNFANSTTPMAEETTAATRSSPSPTTSLSLMSCLNQMTTSLSTVLSSSNNEVCSSSSSNDYSSPLSASSANKTNLFYHHRKAFRRKEDPRDVMIIANITIIAIEYVLLLTYAAIIIPIARLAGSTNLVATIRS